MNIEGNNALQIPRNEGPLTPAAEIYTSRSFETDQETRDEMAQNRILDQKTLELHARVEAILYALTQNEREQFHAAFQEISNYRKNNNLSTARNYIDTFSDLVQIYEREENKREQEVQTLLTSIDLRIAALKPYITEGEQKSLSLAREEMLSYINQKQYTEAKSYNNDLSDLLDIYEEEKREKRFVMRGYPIGEKNNPRPTQNSSPENKKFAPNELNSLLMKSTPEIQQEIKNRYGIDVDMRGILQGEDPNNVLDLNNQPDTMLSKLLAELQTRTDNAPPTKWDKIWKWLKS